MFVRNFVGSDLSPPAAIVDGQGSLIFELDFGRFWDSDSGHFRPVFGVGPRTKVIPNRVLYLGKGVLSRDFEIFQRCVIALDTHMLPVTRDVGFFSGMTEPIRGVGISSIWGDDMMVSRDVGFSSVETDLIRGVRIFGVWGDDMIVRSHVAQVSRGVGFSSVETDLIRGVGISGVWGDDMIVRSHVAQVSCGVGFSGVETDPICGFGTSGIWGDYVIVRLPVA
ncbi:hypothetical protein L3X38_011711 [Prunus dulcis]|uniref:Uncharacterized protein n=1 Tax=Prunus dulcis TaxID=3755 RepID=A0AAD4WHX5_PRUDU|nr:hypothetical protein L3X38_011711 [Prunus dulcis]